MTNQNISQKTMVILGATSAIAQATAQLYASEGYRFVLLARNKVRLESVAADLKARGATATEILPGELSDNSQIKLLFLEIKKIAHQIDILLVAYGSLGDQEAAQKDATLTRNEIETNFTSVVNWLTYFAQYFESKHGGTIAVISSVAGDRGRKKNYIYGAAKAGLSTFLSGLRNRLFSFGVNVITIKPGFVDTPMTAHIPKGMLFASPNAVAKGIYKTIEAKRDVVYLPWFWRYIMMIICYIPERIFKRLNI